MMKKYAVAAAFAGSLLAAPAFAQDATSCEAMLSEFDAHLTANNIEQSDPRVAQARTEAEQACMSGDMTTAESSLDKAVADLGIPPLSGAGGSESGSNEPAGEQSGGAATGSTGTTGTSTDTQSGGASTTVQ